MQTYLFLEGDIVQPVTAPRLLPVTFLLGGLGVTRVLRSSSSPPAHLIPGP